MLSSAFSSFSMFFTVRVFYFIFFLIYFCRKRNELWQHTKLLFLRTLSTTRDEVLLPNKKCDSDFLFAPSKQNKKMRVFIFATLAIFTLILCAGSSSADEVNPDEKFLAYVDNDPIWEGHSGHLAASVCLPLKPPASTKTINPNYVLPTVLTNIAAPLLSSPSLPLLECAPPPLTLWLLLPRLPSLASLLLTDLLALPIPKISFHSQ
jgi:hypothetical protein